MHYFKREIGDYYKKAGRLGMLEHGACTLLTDACYDREQFPTLQEALDWTWASSEKEIEAVTFVLSRLFRLEDGVYINDEIQTSIAKYHKNATTNQRIAIDREAKKRENKTNGVTNSTKREPSVNESIEKTHETAPNQEPRTKNHKPITNIKDLPSNNEETVFLLNITNHWNEIMATQPKINLSDKTKATKSRIASIKKIAKDYPDYLDDEYWQGYFYRLSTMKDFDWQRQNKQIVFDQATNLKKFARNIELMRMEEA